MTDSMDGTEPEPPPEPTVAEAEAAPAPAPETEPVVRAMVRSGPTPIELVPLGLAVVAVLLLAGGVLFAFANANSSAVDSSARFRLLAQAANPFIAFLALVAASLVVWERRGPAPIRTVGPALTLGIATAVNLAVALLAINGIITDLTGDAAFLFRLSAVVSRLATLVLSGLCLWLAATSEPRRDTSRPTK